MLRNAVVGVFHISELQGRILEVCEKVFNAEACSLFLIDENSRQLRMSAARGYAEKFLDRPYLLELPAHASDSPARNEEKLGLTGWIAATGEPLRFNGPDELRDHPHWRGDHDVEQFGSGKRVQNFYGVPLRVSSDEVIGVLKVEGKRFGGAYTPFTSEDADMFEILAAHIATAITASRRVEQIERQQAQLQTITDALHKVVGALSEERPMQHLLDEIVDTTAEVLSAEACVLFLKDDKSEMLVERAGEGYVKQLVGQAKYRLIPRDEFIEVPEKDEDRVGLTAWIAITGQPFLARNNKELRAHPHWRGQYDPEHYRKGSGKKCESFLGVPLLVAEKVVGVLKVENKRVDGKYVSFNERDRQVFETLSRSIAIAIGTVQEQRLKREQSVTDAMYRVSEALAGRFRQEDLLAEIVKTGKDIVNAEACVVFLVDQAHPTLLIETAGEGYVEHLIGKAQYKLIPRSELTEHPERDEDKVGLTAWIAITGKSFLARNNDELRAHPHWRGHYDVEHYGKSNRTKSDAASKKKCESFLGLPLRVGEEILGVLKVENKKINDEYVPFDEREQHIFQILANSAGIAIRNARDFEKLREAEDLAAIGTSASAMAHRMGAPTQRTLTAAENLEEILVEEGSDSESKLDRIKSIKDAIGQMTDAILRVREIARPIHPKLATYSVATIARIVKDCLESEHLVQDFAKRRITAEIEEPRQVRGGKLKCDKRLLEEALYNLIDNARDAIGSDGRITVCVESSDREVTIEVRDDGGGISKWLADPYQPFKTTKEGGLGLGLFIVRRNIEAQGGSVSSRRENDITCFRLGLPLDPH
jgi:GAF domain-containing protein